MSNMESRTNKRLNEYIEQQIRVWSGTAHGVMIRNAYENGCDYETICELIGIDYEDWEEDE